jgi:hypothetical protein
MIVDSSYLAWVRPTRRVHLALSVGMTVTGVVLTAMGISGTARPAPAPRRSAEPSVIRTENPPAGALLPGPLAQLAAPTAPTAPVAPAAPATAHPVPKPHPKPRPHTPGPVQPSKR